MKLTDTTIRNAVQTDKPYKLADGNGLYLLINTAGKYWRLDYRLMGKRNTLSIGVYPKVSLKAAREKCRIAHNDIDQGINPNLKRKTLKQEQNSSNTLEYIAREWFDKNKSIWSTKHADKIIKGLELNIFPWFKNTDIKSITAIELLKALRVMEDRGAISYAHRIKHTCGCIFRYAINTGKLEYDVSAYLKGALTPFKVKNRSAITNPIKVGKLLRDIDTYNGHFTTQCALKLAPIVFLRPGELRQGEWSEINFKNNTWEIPKDKMKMDRPHIIPLSNQAKNILLSIQPFSQPKSIYIFPSVKNDKHPLGINTITFALRSMGYTKDEMTGHGFRAMASTLLHENGFETLFIEAQLAHAEKNTVKAAYNHAKYLGERMKMMQWWADYLDTLKGDIPI